MVLRKVNKNMISKVKVINSIVFSICFLLLGGLTFAEDGNKKLKKITIVLGAQNSNAPYGGFADLMKNEVFFLDEATENQKSIDMVYTYGSKTGLNIMTPSSISMGSFGKRYKDAVIGNWKTRNRGSFLVLRDSREARKLYKQIKLNKQLVELYSKTVQTIMLQDDYSKDNHGPGARVRGLNVGDFILFRSRGVKRGVYAMGRVVNWKKGYEGEVTIDFKVLSN